MFDLHTVNKISDCVYIIAENLRNDFVDTMVLVIGENEACLIDTGCGIGNVKKLVGKYTDKSVYVLNTHLHLDHVGGNGLFQRCFLADTDPKDIKATMNINARLNFLKAATLGDAKHFEAIKRSIQRKENFVPCSLYDGRVFDLGGVQLEAISVPGHTKDSFAFIDKGHHTAYVGDSINRTPWLHIKDSTSVEEYEKSLDRFIEKTEGIHFIVCGHEPVTIGYEVVLDSRQCVKEILSGCDDPIVDSYAGKALEHTCGCVKMLYCENKIYKNQKGEGVV